MLTILRILKNDKKKICTTEILINSTIKKNISMGDWFKMVE